jgi:hypothetical protein
LTESKLEATAAIKSFSVQIGKQIGTSVDLYAAYAYEHIDVTSTYTYVLPHETQVQLGLLPDDPPGGKSEPTAERPGDTQPQVSTIAVENLNHKLVLGASAQIGPVRAALDMNFSSFNILTFGLAYTFNQPD